jgi:hypothetical protein
LRVNDDTLCTNDQVNAEAERLMLAISRNSWEGAIGLSGQFRCIDWDSTSDSFGSGKVVTLTWGPLGISALKMKVTRAVMTPHETVIYVNNVDPKLRNNLTRSMGSEERTGSFLPSTGIAETVYAMSYFTTAITTGTDPLYAEIEDGVGTDLWHRVKCTKYENTTLNLRTYHFELEAGFMATIATIKLYDAMTAGNLIATISLSRTVSSIVIDETISKLFASRVIVEVLAPAS